MVADLDPLVEGLHLRRVRGPAELESQRRNALVDEIHLVGADETVLVGLLVELWLNIVELADRACVVAQSRLAEPLNLEVLQREERQVHVHVEVGDDVGLLHGGFGGEVLRAELAHLFSRKRNEEYRSLGTRTSDEQLSDLDDRGDAGRVVHGAVVDGIAIDRTAHAEVVQMRGDDDVLMLELAVGALKLADDVRRIDVRDDLDGSCGRDGSCERKDRQRLAGVADSLDLVVSMAGVGEELLRTSGRKGGVETQPAERLDGRVRDEVGSTGRRGGRRSGSWRRA